MKATTNQPIAATVVATPNIQRPMTPLFMPPPDIRQGEWTYTLAQSCCPGMKYKRGVIITKCKRDCPGQGCCDLGPLACGPCLVCCECCCSAVVLDPSNLFAENAHAIDNSSMEGNRDLYRCLCCIGCLLLPVRLGPIGPDPCTPCLLARYRAKLQRKYNLPPFCPCPFDVACCPDSCKNYWVEYLCTACSACQITNELIARGDRPNLKDPYHSLLSDATPNSYLDSGSSNGKPVTSSSQNYSYHDL